MPPSDYGFQIFYRSRLWGFIWAYIGLTYLTLPVMRIALRSLREWLGPQYLSLGFSALMIVAGLALIGYASRLGKGPLLRSLLPLAVLSGVALSMNIPEERTHFVQYGLLGVLVTRTLREHTVRQLVVALVFVILVGCVDELIQWWLPNRVGDWRDVGMNTLAGTLGIAIGIALFVTPGGRGGADQGASPNSTIS